MNIIRSSAFTLIEIIVVIVIIGVLASLAVPRMVGAKDQTIFTEGINVLNTLNAAQIRYNLEKSTYDTSAACANLDVTVTPTNFAAPVCNTSTGAVSLTIKSAVQPATGSYTVSVSAAGAFSCGSCPNTLKKICPNTPCA